MSSTIARQRSAFGVQYARSSAGARPDLRWASPPMDDASLRRLGSWSGGGRGWPRTRFTSFVCAARSRSSPYRQESPAKTIRCFDRSVSAGPVGAPFSRQARCGLFRAPVLTSVSNTPRPHRRAGSLARQRFIEPTARGGSTPYRRCCSGPTVRVVDGAARGRADQGRLIRWKTRNRRHRAAFSGRGSASSAAGSQS